MGGNLGTWEIITHRSLTAASLGSLRLVPPPSSPTSTRFRPVLTHAAILRPIVPSFVRSIDRSPARSLSLENHPPSPSLSDAHLCAIDPHSWLCYSTKSKSARCSLLPSDESHRGRAFAFEGPSRAAPALSASTVRRPSPSCPAHPSIRHPSPVGPLGRTLLLFNLTTNLSPNPRSPFLCFRSRLNRCCCLRLWTSRQQPFFRARCLVSLCPDVPVRPFSHALS